jgi:hypothetical protein
MDTIRLFLRSNSFINSQIKTDLNRKSLSIKSDIINPIDETLTERSSSSEKCSRDNIKSFLSTHPSSSSLSSCIPFNSSQLETCSGLSIPLSNNSTESNIVASASESISNARSFTSEDYSKEHRRKRQRRHSWTSEHHHHHHHISSTLRRTKSHRYSDKTKKYSTEIVKRKVIQVNRSSKSISFPLPTNQRSVKTTATNAFLTAASLLKYWVYFIFISNGMLFAFFVFAFK